MKIGTFLMPNNPPERSVREAHEWNLDHIRHCDELGYAEAWIGEHFTVPWEACPAPDLMIAQALTQTRNIKLDLSQNRSYLFQQVYPHIYNTYVSS